MCNLSELIEEKGIEKGIEQGKIASLCSLVTKGLLTEEIATKELGITAEEFAEEMKKLKSNFSD